MKVVSVVGNRPQFVKSAPLSLALRRAGIDEVVVHTGQHYDRTMSALFYAELEIDEPRHVLDLRTADPAAMVPGIAAAITVERPECVLVHGDTNSTLAGAQAAVGAGVAVAHVEAGLRSGDIAMPEERNRIEVDRLSALLLAPDERSRAILEAEGVSGEIAVVGDVMADASRLFASLARERCPIGREPGSRPMGQRSRASGEKRRLASAITSPTTAISPEIPSASRVARDRSSGASKSAESRSTSIRLRSSGIARSPERSPASTCATRTPAPTAASVPASVEFVSP